MSEKTCGPLYKEGLVQFTAMDPKLIPIFAAGFISGQAEKIYLGACQAAMFRPSDPWWEEVWRIIGEVGDRYGLLAQTLKTSRGVEIWLCASPSVAASVRGLPAMGENSGRWHVARGALCGVPIHKIDQRFHERSGYGERCD